MVNGMVICKKNRARSMELFFFFLFWDPDRWVAIHSEGPQGCPVSTVPRGEDTGVSSRGFPFFFSSVSLNLSLRSRSSKKKKTSRNPIQSQNKLVRTRMSARCQHHHNLRLLRDERSFFLGCEASFLFRTRIPRQFFFLSLFFFV